MSATIDLAPPFPRTRSLRMARSLSGGAAPTVTGNVASKRAIDVVVATTVLVMALPLLILAARDQDRESEGAGGVRPDPRWSLRPRVLPLQAAHDGSHATAQSRSSSTSTVALGRTSRSSTTRAVLKAGRCSGRRASMSCPSCSTCCEAT